MTFFFLARVKSKHMLQSENTCTTIALVVILMLILMDIRRTRVTFTRTCGTDCEKKKAEATDEVEEEAVVAARAVAASTQQMDEDGDVKTLEPTVVKRTEREEKYKKAFVTALQPTSDCTKATRSKGIPGLQHTMLAAMKCGGDASEQTAAACAEDKLPSSTCMWHMAPAHMPLHVAVKMQEEDAEQRQPSLVAKREAVTVE